MAKPLSAIGFLDDDRLGTAGRNEQRPLLGDGGRPEAERTGQPLRSWGLTSPRSARRPGQGREIAGQEGVAGDCRTTPPSRPGD